MNNKSSDTATQLLEGAYALRTPQDNIEYYRGFSHVYDEKFANDLGYIYPSLLAKIYREHANRKDTPIADIGCGTGLVAQALITRDNVTPLEIDGIDISPEMLEVARTKSRYRSLHQTDLTQGTKGLPGNYGAVLSAGTFTFGHLGPQTLPALLSIGRAETLFCIGVNSTHYKEQGFTEVLDTMIKLDQISSPLIEQCEIYTDKNSDHANDTATVLIFRQQ